MDEWEGRVANFRFGAIVLKNSIGTAFGCLIGFWEFKPRYLSH